MTFALKLVASNSNGAGRVAVPKRRAGAADPVRVYLDGLPSPRSKAGMRDCLVRLSRLTDAYHTAPMPLCEARPGAGPRMRAARSIHHWTNLERSDEAVEAIAWHRLDFECSNALRALLVERYPSPATVAMTLCALRGLLRTCFRMGLMSHEEFARATSWGKLQGSRLPRGRALAPQEVQTLASWCRAQAGVYGAFVRATFAILIGVGMRADQLCTLPMMAYLQDQRSLRSVGKGNKEHLVPLGDQEAEAIESWLKCRPTEIWTRGSHLGECLPAGEAMLLSISPSRSVWASRLQELRARRRRNGQLQPGDDVMALALQLREEQARGLRLVDSLESYFAKAMSKDSLRRLCERAAKECGLAHFTPHDCRRTFATRLLSEGVDLATVQRLMCHAFPSTTVRYDRRSDDSDAKARRRVILWPV